MTSLIRHARRLAFLVYSKGRIRRKKNHLRQICVRQFAQHFSKKVGIRRILFYVNFAYFQNIKKWVSDEIVLFFGLSFGGDDLTESYLRSLYSRERERVVVEYRAIMRVIDMVDIMLSYHRPSNINMGIGHIMQFFAIRKI